MDISTSFDFSRLVQCRCSGYSDRRMTVVLGKVLKMRFRYHGYHDISICSGIIPSIRSTTNDLFRNLFVMARGRGSRSVNHAAALAPFYDASRELVRADTVQTV